VLAGDVGDHHMQSLPAWQRRVDEGAGPVQAPPGQLEHPFDEVAHLGLGEDRRGELGGAVARDEDLLRRVDPDLLDGVVVQVLLQGTESTDGVLQGLAGRRPVGERGDLAAQRPLVVGVEGIADEAAQHPAITDRVHATVPDQLAHLVLELCRCFPHAAPPGCAHAVLTLCASGWRRA